MEDDGALVLQSAVVMPDHLHLLGIAPGRLAIGQIVGRLKAKTRGILQTVGLSWQGNFFEHRLRPTDRIEDVLHYLFLNPYRTQLVSPSEAYPWFWLGSDEAAWFRPMLMTTDLSHRGWSKISQSRCNLTEVFPDFSIE